MEFAKERLQPIGGVLTGGSISTTFLDQQTTDEVLATIEELAPAILRFPAGGHANFYDWESGSYRLWQPGIGGLSPHREIREMRLEDFFELADRFGAEVAFIVNVVHDPPQKSRALAERIRELGYDVRYWELGNETADPRFRERFPDVDAYLRIAEAHADAMREIFPDAEFGVATDVRDVARSEWNRRLARQTRFDRIIIHRYWGPLREARERMARRGETAPIDRVYPRLIENSAPRPLGVASIFPGKRYWISEWGLLYLDTDVQNSMAHAIWVARTFLRYLRTPEVEMAAYWNFNASPFELVDVVDGKVVRRVPYYAFAMFSRRLRAAELTAPVSLTRDGRPVPGLDGQILVDRSGRTSILVVNSTGSRQRIAVPARPSDVVKVEMLEAAEPALTNGYSVAATASLRTQAVENVAPRRFVLEGREILLEPYAVAAFDWVQSSH